jgi:tRNA(fMet)-specific endonuclease VapC
MPFEVPADGAHGSLRSDLELSGRPNGGNDMLIAAHASASGATIVTANTGAFERVRGLAVENWLA